MIKAVFLDFYGTVVHEDADVIQSIVQQISADGNERITAKISAYWSAHFSELCASSYGDSFVTQRRLEMESLQKTIQNFDSSVDAAQLSNLMYTYWATPPIFDDAQEFFTKSQLPICIISNIDRNDIELALAFHSLHPHMVITSEDAKSYKPRAEIFTQALYEMHLSPLEVLHIGDSISSDIKGAIGAGIKPIWLNRDHRRAPKEESYTEISSLYEALELIDRA
jgi:HAD superfamily hydrolase (TIGR01549 family)